MSDNLDARARLSIEIEGLEKALSLLDKAVQAGGETDKAWKAVATSLEGIKTQTKGAGDAADAAGEKADKAAGKWKKLTDAMAKADKANTKAARKDATDTTVPKDIAKKPVAELTRDELEAVERVSIARRANYERDALKRLDGIRKAEAAEVAAQSKAEAAILASLDRIQAKRISVANREARAYMNGMDAGIAPDRSRSLSVAAPRTGAQRSLKAASVADWDRQFAAAEAAVGKAALRQQEEMLNSLPRLRYALYDVATTAGIASTAITGVGAASVAAFASMESSFTNVERTLDGVTASGVTQLRDELVGLTREIPLAFADISQIATLGNQLGIASSDIAQFTETTAKFSAVTGLTAEASAQAFGSLGELLNVSAAEYENLGSSIALVGRRSVATESEIVAMTQRLAASATNAGFTAQEVVALSGALASLRVAPERAQGVMEVYFNRLNTAINEGGERLQAFAAIAGESADGVRQLAQNDPVGLFRRLANGLGSMNQQAQTGALEALGLQGIRAGEVFGRVSANVEVFDKALGDANQGWIEGSELASQYALVVDDLASRWQIFLNAVQEAGAAVGAILAPFIEEALRVTTDLLQKFTEFAQTPFGGWVVGAGAAVAALTAIVAGLISAAALASASFLAIRTAIGALRVDMASATGAAAGLSTSMGILGTSTGFAARAMSILRGAIAATGIGALLMLAISLFTDFNGTMTTTINVVEWLYDNLLKVVLPFQNIFGVIIGLANAFGLFTTDIENFANYFIGAMGQVAAGGDALTSGFEEIFANIGNFFSQIGGFFQELGNGIVAGASGIAQAAWVAIGPVGQAIIKWLGEVGSAVDSFFARFRTGFSAGMKMFDASVGNAFDGLRSAFAGSGAASSTNIVAGALRNATKATGGFNKELVKLGGGPGGGGGGGNAGGAAKAVRTLVDYANDLSGVFKRSFDLRFGNQRGLDSITSGWRSIAEASASAREEIAKYQATLAELSADRQIKQYWLMVAENYGDTLRAAKLRAELAELDNEQSAAQRDLSKAQEKTNKTLTGNSSAAIENRETVLDMLGSYQDLLKTYAENGMSQQDLQRKAAQLKQEFINQALQAGFSRNEINRYAAAFDDMGIAINRVPRNITVAANVNPALQALAEFEAKAKTAARNAANSIRTGGGGGYGMPTITPTVKPVVDLDAARKAGLAAGRAIREQVINGISVIKIGNRSITAPGADLYGRKEGGYTGNAGESTVTGFHHGREFVMSAPAVRTLGVNGMNYLHNALKSGRVPSIGGGGGGGMVELSPVDRSLLMEIAAAARSAGFPGASVLQAVVNGGNANFAQRRSA